MTTGEMNIETAGTSAYPERIGGWLYCPAFGLVTGCLITAVLVFVGATTVLFASNLWSAPTVTSGGDAIPRAQHDAYQAELNKGRGILATVVGLEAALLAFLVRASIRFFRKKCNAPAAIIQLLIAQIVLHGLILALLLVVYDGHGFNWERLFSIFAGDVLAAVFWIPYFRVSKRVKRTFVVA
jgi:uncharacterized protein DUF2569